MTAPIEITAEDVADAIGVVAQLRGLIKHGATLSKSNVEHLVFVETVLASVLEIKHRQ